MRKSKLEKNNNEHEKLELNNDLSDIEKGITEDGQILPEESYKLLMYRTLSGKRINNTV